MNGAKETDVANSQVYDLTRLQKILTSAARLAGSFHRIVRFQDPVRPLDPTTRNHVKHGWQDARSAFGEIATLLDNGRIGIYELKFYTIDPKGYKVARLDSELVTDLLRELWVNIAWLGDTEHETASSEAKFRLERILFEMNGHCKRLRQIISAEELRTDLL